MTVCISAKNVSVDFSVNLSGQDVTSGDSRISSSGRGGATVIHALRDVSLEAEKGDRVGIIGPNGAGKSTILRTLAGIYTPTSGTIKRVGRVQVMFQPGLGVQPEVSGYENIKLLGLFHGMTLDEIEDAIPSIEEFCELGEFLKMPIKSYSTGMRMRLVYAVVTASSPQILLLDEVIGVGDKSFARKVTQRRRSFMAQPDILLLTSHAFGLLREFCNRMIWLDKGRVREDSRDIEATIDRYLEETKRPGK